MARTRTIKPDFPQSESVGRLSRDARLLFIQLWTVCDDSGKSRASSRALASLLYPYDDDAKNLIDAWLTELESEGHIHRYEVAGSSYLKVTKWLKHQKIDNPSKPKFPDPIEPSRETIEPSRNLSSPREPSCNVSGNVSSLPSPPPSSPPSSSPLNNPSSSPSTSPPSSSIPLSLASLAASPSANGRAKRATRIADDWKPSEKNTSDAKAEGLTEREIDRQASIFIDYWKAKGGQNATKLDWDATWRNWVRRTANDLGRAPNGKGPAYFSLWPTTPEWQAWWAYLTDKAVHDRGARWAKDQMTGCQKKNEPYPAVAQWPPGYQKSKSTNGATGTLL